MALRLRTRLEFLGCIAALVWLLSHNVAAMQPGAIASETEFWRFALAQSGGTLCFVITAYFYRRDVFRMLGEKEQQIAVLTQIVERDAVTKIELTSAIAALTVELRERRK